MTRGAGSCSSWEAAIRIAPIGVASLVRDTAKRALCAARSPAPLSMTGETLRTSFAPSPNRAYQKPKSAKRRDESARQRTDGKGRPRKCTAQQNLCGGGVPSSHPSLGLSVFFLSLRKRCETAVECKVPIWASSIGPSRHALLAGGLLGHGTSGEIVAASSRLGPIELDLFGGGIRPARVQRGVPGESPAAET